MISIKKRRAWGGYMVRLFRWTIWVSRYGFLIYRNEGYLIRPVKEIPFPW